ncbi:dolabradiene monooxygenase-like [Phragmites australis]|uniref:dolabradiene monooxygenase-like n=1 Tax=Phragmites australis TaxID=29695 RepID=UPI002D77E8E9|nr:dolabradiene monooxygenase-like [Phragmites australis]
MEDKMLLAVTVVVLLVVLSKLKSFLAAKPKLKLPPGPWRLPVIGSIHHLGTSPLIYRALSKLAQKHGPLMTFHLGEVPALVVSSPEAAQAVMKTHDISFADRFANSTLATLTYDRTDLVFAPYGERWRQLRKICVLEMLSSGRVQSFRRIREEEVARFMQNVATSAAAGATVDLTKGISKFVNDAFVMECVGSRCKYQDEYLDAFHMAVLQTSVLSVADLFPSSRIMQMLGTAPRKALACRERIQRILQQIIQEKEEALDRGDKTAYDSILGVLLRLQKERSTPIPLTNDTIVTLMFDLFGAGSDTSSTALTWCMAELMRSPAVMAKAQAKVREAYKGKSALTEDDIAGEELSYLKLVVKETLRLHTPAPLLLPRQCRETCQIMGYDIPKGTAVFVNVWAICRDPKYWDDAEEFKPERFENSNLDYKGTNFEYLPFGAGRRMCPGVNLGLANIELALASLLYHFDWKLPDGMKPKDVDVWEAEGLIAKKKTGLILHPVTRIALANS